MKIMMMKGFAALLIAIVCAATSQAQENAPLRLVTTISLPQVSGRFDWLALDLKGQRLFIATRNLEKRDLERLGLLADPAHANTVEVIDLRTGQLVHTILGFGNPQGLYYLPFAKKLFVASLDGTFKIVSGDSLEVVDSIQLSPGANVILYDPRTRYLYIGDGGNQSAAISTLPSSSDALTDKDPGPGQIAIVDATSGKPVGNIQIDAEQRPGAMVMEQSGPRLFASIPFSNQVVVVDRKKRTVVAKWPVPAVPSVKRTGTVALDEARRRVFVGTRDPASVIVLDADSGKLVTSFPTVEGIDRLFWDIDTKRLYATGSPKVPFTENPGSIEAYRQVDADHYELVAKIPTVPDGGTSLLVPQIGRLYVAVPRYGQRNAEIRVYDTRP